MTVHNLLFCPHTLCMNYVTNTFPLVSSSVRSKQLLGFVQGQGQKTEQTVPYINYAPTDWSSQENNFWKDQTALLAASIFFDTFPSKCTKSHLRHFKSFRGNIHLDTPKLACLFGRIRPRLNLCPPCYAALDANENFCKNPDQISRTHRSRVSTVTALLVCKSASLLEILLKKMTARSNKYKHRNENEN